MPLGYSWTRTGLKLTTVGMLTVKIAGKPIGMVKPALLAVVYTARGKDGDTIRLISARKADAHERTQYREI